MSVSTWLFTISLSLSVYSVAERDSDCAVLRLVSEPWPVYIFAPQESIIIINCTADSEHAFWSIDLANDSVSSQHQFSSREDILNDHGVYELPQIETPGMPSTLRLMINDTAANNQTEILCTGGNKTIHTTLFIIDPNPLAFEITAMNEQYINISWVSSSLNLVSLAAQSVYYNLTISHGSISDSQLISLNESTYHFTAPEGAPPCEVYNFSVTLVHANNVDVRTGCSVLLETILYSRNPLDTNYDLWTEVDLLGELILNIIVKEACNSISYTLEPSADTISNIMSNKSIANYTLVHNLTFSTHNEGASSYSIKFYIKQLNDSEIDIIKDMNVAFLCDADNAPYLQCTLVLISVYSDVIVRVTYTGGNNNSAVEEVNSCNKSSAIYNEDELNFTADDYLNHEKIITRNFSINSTMSCPSNNNISTAAKDQWLWIVAVIITIIVIVLSLFAIILVSILGVRTVRKIRRKKINSRQHTTSMPLEHQAENGEQNHYQDVKEVQISTQPQEIVPVYDHVNLNNTHEVTYRTDDEAGYNTTQHMLQQTPSNYEAHENGGGNYAKLQNDENHHYHTLERDRDPRGIEVNAYIASSPDNRGSPLN